nr:hypothetical protein [Enterococcus sp. DIV2402]
MVVTGKNGSGKTQFLYYLILECAHLTSEIVILDGKNGDLSNLTAVKIGRTTEEIVRIFEEMISEMKRRISKIQELDLGNILATEVGYEPVFCFIDELAAIMINARKTDRKNKENNKENNKNKSWQKLREDHAISIMESLSELILIARQSSIHLCICSQFFPAKLLEGSEVRSNTSIKILLGSQTPQEYNMLNLVQDQLPPGTFSEIGAGIIMIDNLNWTKARYFETPFITFNNCTPNEILKKRILEFRDSK